MIRIALQTCLTVMALTFSGSGALAGSCEPFTKYELSELNVEECSNEQLCRVAIESFSVPNHRKAQGWKWNYDLIRRYQNVFVEEAKRREIKFEALKKPCRKSYFWCGHTCTWPGKESNAVALQKSNNSVSQIATLFNQNDFNALNSPKRKQLQYGLKKLGYYTSSIDGKYGPNTQRAVRGYAKAKGITSGYPNSVYDRIVSDVNVPSSFASTQQSTSSSSSSGSDAGKVLMKGALITLVCALTPNAAACLDGAMGNAGNYGSSSSSGNSSVSSNSCSSNYDCASREVCIKRAAQGKCMRLPRGKSRSNFEATECSNNSDCPGRSKCNRTYKVCVKR